MKFLLLAVFIIPLAFAEPQVCPGTIQLSESDEGPLFSGTLTEGTYTSKFSYVDDDGLLTLIATNNVILHTNNQFTSPPEKYRISDREKNLVIESLKRQAAYNLEAISILRESQANNTPQPEDAPTIPQVEALSAKVATLLSFVQGIRNEVSAADWNSKVGKYIKEEMRAGHVYQSKTPNMRGEFDSHGLCASTVRCPCSINSSPFNRGRLCGIDYENPAPKTGEYTTCSSFNLTIESGSASRYSRQTGTRTQKQ